MRHVTAAEAAGGQIREALLLVERDGIIDLAADFFAKQMIFERIALSSADDAEGELVPDVRVVAVGDGKHDFGSCGGEGGILRAGAFAVRGIGLHDAGQFLQRIEVVGRVALAVGGVLRVAFQFHAEQGALQRVHAEVSADVVMVVLRLAAMHTQHAGVFG